MSIRNLNFLLRPTSVAVIGLNTSFSRIHALPGSIAFLSQSGALRIAVLDWARSKNNWRISAKSPFLSERYFARRARESYDSDGS